MLPDLQKGVTVTGDRLIDIMTAYSCSYRFKTASLEKSKFQNVGSSTLKSVLENSLNFVSTTFKFAVLPARLRLWKSIHLLHISYLREFQGKRYKLQAGKGNICSARANISSHIVSAKAAIMLQNYEITFNVKLRARPTYGVCFTILYLSQKLWYTVA